MKTRLSIVFIVTIVVLSLLSALTLAEGDSAESLHLDIFATPEKFEQPGDQVTLVYQLFDNTITGTDVIFYAPIPEDTQFVNVQNAVPQSYTIGVLSEFTGMQAQTAVLPPADVKSVIWTGTFAGPRYITLTVESLNGRGTVAEAALINNVTHVTAMTDTLRISGEEYVVFLPMVSKDYTAPTPTPTVQPTPQPTATPDPSGTVLTPVTTISMGSRNNVNGVTEGTYEDVLFGINLYAEKNQVSTAIYPTQSNVLGAISVGRGGYTFDTRAYNNISSVTLTFRVDAASTFEPENYNLILEKSNWSYLDVPNVPTDITQAQWNGVVSGPVAVIDASGAPKSLYNGMPITKTVTLPIDLFTPSGYSNIRFRLDKEGAEPPDSFGTGGGNEGILFYALELNVVP